jgi:hypothetical protein
MLKRQKSLHGGTGGNVQGAGAVRKDVPARLRPNTQLRKQV